MTGTQLIAVRALAAVAVWALLVVALLALEQLEAQCHTDTECAELCSPKEPDCDGGPSGGYYTLPLELKQRLHNEVWL